MTKTSMYLQVKNLVWNQARTRHLSRETMTNLSLSVHQMISLRKKKYKENISIKKQVFARFYLLKNGHIFSLTKFGFEKKSKTPFWNSN